MHGAELEAYDDERKTPVLYAIEECHFEVVQIMRDHIFLDKYAKKKQMNSILMSESKFENSLNRKSLNKLSTPVRSIAASTGQNQNPQCVNKNLLKVACTNETLNNTGGGEGGVSITDNGKYTPNRINYNYDVTSPYYINITHRRHKPQPKFPTQPEIIRQPQFEEEKVCNDPDAAVDADKTTECEDILSISMQNIRLTTPEPEDYEESVNIFSLTKENLKELTQRTHTNERSKLSLIETWREKVQKSKDRQSILKDFDDMPEFNDVMKENDDEIKPRNTEITENTEKLTKYTENDSGACDSSSSSDMEITQYRLLPQEVKANVKVSEMYSTKCLETVAEEVHTEETKGEIVEKLKEEPIEEFNVHALDKAKVEHTAEFAINNTPSPSLNEVEVIDLDSSYQTVPEIKITSPGEKNDEQNTSTNFIRSPKNNEYFLQMAEAYVHTDDENGLVFYETRLLSNVGNKVANQRNPE